MIGTIERKAPGRRRVDTIPAERLRHLTCLALRRHGKRTVASLARAADASERRVYAWLRMAEGYPEARDPEYLKALAERHARAVSHRRLELQAAG